MPQRLATSQAVIEQQAQTIQEQAAVIAATNAGVSSVTVIGDPTTGPESADART